GEERIRPRKGTFYGVQQIRNGYSLQELGLFSMPHMAGKGFKDWGSTPAVGEPEVIVTQEHWINTTTLEKVGTMKFDAGYGSQTTTIVLAIVLSEAQFLGNETSPDVLGYPLYNIMLIEKVREDHGMLFAERIGLGKIYK
ncbi:hypothetical protein GQ44DRAFT_564581, partial [Phaeosphaeriaceae sp. PMI808]